MIKQVLLTTMSAVALMTLVPGSVHADQCGTNPKRWNVPRGSAMFMQSEGPIRAVMQGIGEWRSHVVLSQGESSVVHSTMLTPGQRDSGESGFCDAPVDVNALHHGYPGIQHLSVAAFQAYSKSATWTGYQNANYTEVPPGYGTGMAVGHDMALVADDFQRATDSPAGIDRRTVHGTPTPYYLNQYMNSDRAEWTYPTKENGLVCSTLLAHLQGKWASSMTDFKAWTTGYPPDRVVNRFIRPHQYTHDQTMSAGYQLYDSVKADCQNGTGFWDGVGSALWCAFDFDLCDDAAAQVRNCMAFGDCANGDVDPFDEQAARPDFAAYSISPDYLGGWVAGQNFSGPRQSVWAWDGSRVVQYDGESVYDCWH